MTEQRPDGGMIEIGDPDEPPAGDPAPGPAPQVVIEYRDRGVPWMLVPPLLALVAVVAGVGAYNYTATLKSQRPTPPALAANPAPPAADDLAEPISGPPPPVGRPEGAPQPPPPAAIENPATPVAPPPEPANTSATPTAAPAADPLMMLAEATGRPPGPVDPPPTRLLDLGFDPKAFETPVPGANPAEGANPVDLPANAAAPPGTPADRPLMGPGADQPDAVDPDLLPPDPRKARAERQKREGEARARAEKERFEFHANLNLIYKKFGSNSGPKVRELCQAFGQDVSPAAKNQAVQALGRTGMFAGANRKGRISLLRKLGFPEPAILGDIFDMESRHETPDARDSPSKEGLYLHSVRILLQHPPGRPAGTNRLVPLPATHARAQPADSPADAADADDPQP